MTKLKHTIQSFNNRFDQTKEGISELENKSFAIIHSGEQKEIRMKNSESPCELWNTIKKTTTTIYALLESQEKRRRRTKVYLRK